MQSAAIPVKNIFHLLAYSWDSLDAAELVDVSRLESSELVDLLAAVLLSGVQHLMRRGLDQAYLLREEDIAGVRGRIDVGLTSRRMLMQAGRTHCTFDELSVDCLPNQIIYSTALRLLSSSVLNMDLRNQLRSLTRDLTGISQISMSKRLFRTVQLHGNNRVYRFLLNVCELALDTALLSEEAGEFRFRDFIRDQRRMAKLFENFVFNYFRVNRADLEIRKEYISWQATSVTDPMLSYLPTMKTDVSVRFPCGRTLIIDTKFYKDTFQTHFDRESIHSGNLYQIYSYVRNLEAKGDSDTLAEGMLLYPVVDRAVKQTYELPGHKIHIATLNLAEDWRSIEANLDAILS